MPQEKKPSTTKNSSSSLSPSVPPQGGMSSSNPVADYSQWAGCLMRAAGKSEADRQFFGPIMSSLEWASGIALGTTPKSDVTQDHIGQHRAVISGFYSANEGPSADNARPAIRNADTAFRLLFYYGDRARALSRRVFSYSLKNAWGSRRARSQAAPPRTDRPARNTSRKVFIGHGRSKLWRDVVSYLSDELHLKCEAFESESRVGNYVGPILQKMLRSSGFAVIVVTKEDSAGTGRRIRPRMNVVHEAGLTQGAYGFARVALLEQRGVKLFSNVDGLQTIPFHGENIKSTFHEIHRMLVREGFVTRPMPAGAKH